METFAVQYARDFCALAYRCCAPEHVNRLFPYGSPNRDAEDCRQLMQGDLAQNVQVLRARLAPVTYDGPRATRCLARLATMSCADLVAARTELLQPPWECDSVFGLRQGSAPLDAACGKLDDCAPGLFCHELAQDHPGVCRPLSENPGACPPACPAGMFCSFETGPLCVAGAADGAVCRDDRSCARKVCWGADPPLGQGGTCGLPASVCLIRP
jgi:hypothetical protein